MAVTLTLATLVLLLQTRPFYMPSSSNEPTVLTGDYVIAFCFNSRCWFEATSIPLVFFFEPRLGDLVVFRKPGDPSVIYMKRIVGMPGDTVQLKDDELYLNGKVVETVRTENVTRLKQSHETEQYQETLPNGASFRTQRIAPGNALSNTAVFTVPERHYFVLEITGTTRRIAGGGWDLFPAKI